MTQAAANLSQTDVARLMGMLTHSTARTLVAAIATEVRAGRLTWEQHRGQADTFGPSLAQQIRNGSSLSVRQISSAKAMLLQRNWRQVVHCLTRDLVSVSDSLLDSARQSTAPTPTYTRTRRNSSNRRSSAPRSRRRRSAAPQPVAPPAPRPTPVVAQAPAQAPATRVCGKQLAYSQLRCSRPHGHRNACIGDAPRQIRQPTNDVDSVLAGRAMAASAATASTELDDAQAKRFALVIEAAWDDVPGDTWVEPEKDPSIERFKLLDLD